MKRGNIYSISHKKKLKRSTKFFSLESTNSFTIYSYETSLNVLFRFSLKICFWKGSFLTNFSPFSPTDCIFLTYYGTRFGIYQALLPNTISVFRTFFFDKSIQSNGWESPRLWTWLHGKPSKVLDSHISRSNISHSSLKTSKGQGYTTPGLRYLEYLDSFRKLNPRTPNQGDR